MNGINHSHSAKLFDPRKSKPVTALGCGSVGSQAILMLAYGGASEIVVYDADAVESHNLPMTLVFGKNDVGRFKVDVLRDRIKENTGIEITPHRRMYVGEPLRGSILCCVDSMEVRMAAWQMARMNPTVDYFIDTRTHEHMVSVYAINPCIPEGIAFYESRLYPTATTPRPTCGSHGIVYVSSLAALLAVRALTHAWSGGIPPLHESVLLSSSGTRVYSTDTEGI